MKTGVELFLDYYKERFAKGEVTEEQLSQMVSKGALDEDEKAWRALWKRFFEAVTIEERRNERCQRTHAPKRYWQDMCEMAP